MHKLFRSFVRTAALAAFIGLVSQASADIVHRYSFDGNVNDSVGTANGQALQLAPGGTPAGVPVTFDSGQATLDGSGGYIELPSGLFTSSTNTTVEAWVTWNGLGNWVRIFDFGNSTSGKTGPDQAIGTGLNYMFLTPNGAASGRARFAITDASNGGERPILNDTDLFPVNEQAHVAITYGGGFAKMYVNGRLAAQGAIQVPLTALQETNNWLGRSQWADPMFGGSYNEFRIHNTNLSGIQIKASALGSPDSLNYDPGTATNITITGESTLTVGGIISPVVTAFFTTIGETVIAPPDVTITSTTTNVVVQADGTLRGAGIGPATIRATRDGVTASFNVTVSPAAPPELKHRYSFTTETNVVTDGIYDPVTVIDSVGGANGTAYGGASATNAVYFTNGVATFPPTSGYQEAAYIDLPDGLISSKTNITIETWITWAGPANQPWHRIFDFGGSSKTDPHQAGGPAAANGYLFLTTAGGTNPRFAARGNGLGENPVLTAGSALPLNQLAHFVVVYAPQYGLSKLYVNGIPVGPGAAPFALTNVTDVNNWIGVAQYNDPPFNGSMTEFRIYEGALTDLDVALHRAAGPDALPADPGALQSVTLEAVPSLNVSNNVRTASVLRANFANYPNLDVTGMGSFSSSDTNIFTVNATGGILPRAAGTATLTGSFQNMPATTTITVVAPTALRITSTNKLAAGQVLVSTALRADFPSATDVNVNGYNGIVHTSSDSNVLTVAANGNIAAVAPGTATITSSYGGQVATKTIEVVMPDNFVRGTLVNRYSFDGPPETTVVTDSIGGQNGELVSGAGTNFTGTGQVALPGGAWNGNPLPAFINLPNGLVSTKSSVTLEGWATPRANTANTRFFDFGMSSGAPDGLGGFGEDAVANPGRSYMFLTPFGGTNPRFAMNTGTAGETPSVTASGPIAVNAPAHFAVSYDQPRGVVRLYINGNRVGTGVATLPLSAIDDRNAWLGRSQWQDPMLNGVFDEFRIWDGPLLDLDVRASYLAGPNTLPTFPTAGPKLTATVAGGNLEIVWPVADAGYTLQSSTTLGTGATWGAAGGTQTVDGTNNKVTLPISTAENRFFRLQKP